jgi:hypothetical protein
MRRPSFAGRAVTLPTIKTTIQIHMSHFTEIKTQIKDIEALRLACQELGLSLVPNTEARGYYENKSKGDYVVQLKGPYDLGGTDILNLDCCCAVNVAVIAVEADLALHLDFVLGQNAVLHPELHGTFGSADLRPVATCTTAEHQLGLGTLFRKLTRIDITILLEILDLASQFLGLGSRRLESFHPANDKSSRTGRRSSPR